MNTKLRREQIVGGADGWNRFLLPLTFSSVDNPTGVINLTGANTLLSVGMRVKFTNEGSTIYGIVTVVLANSFTFLHQMNTNGNGTAINLMQNSEITDAFFSPHKAPLGFPTSPLSWRVVVNDASTRNQGSPAQNQWYNLNNTNIVIPIGVWDISITSQTSSVRGSAGYVSGSTTLSTSTSSASHNQFTSTIGAAGSTEEYGSTFMRDLIALENKTTFYVISRCLEGGNNALNRAALYVRAICTLL